MAATAKTKPRKRDPRLVGMIHEMHETKHHEYRGTREQAQALVEWLMDRGYWFEGQCRSETWTIHCALKPDEIGM